MILVTWATGGIGIELCRLLAQSRVPARAMCRKEDQFLPFIQLGLETALGNFEAPDLLKQAMQGCDRLFLLAPPEPSQFDQYRLVIDLAVEAGIKQIVKISTADSNMDSPVPWAKANALGDHYLRSKSVDWTILRPTGFMQNFLEASQAISRGFFSHVTGAGRVGYIDTRDIALVAKQVLTEDSHVGATYYLTGPEALSAADIVAALSTGLGHPINEMPTTPEAMRQRLQQAGLDEWRVEAILAQYGVIAGGYACDVTEEVKRLTGIPPRSFVQFAQDYKPKFSGAHAD